MHLVNRPDSTMGLIEFDILELANRAALRRYQALTARQCVSGESSDGAKGVIHRKKIRRGKKMVRRKISLSSCQLEKA